MDLTTLSWMLLLADRAEGFGICFILIGLVGMLLGGMTCLSIYSDMNEQERKESKLHLYLLGIVIPAFLLGFLFNLVPSEGVILKVAAIELGEDVVKSDAFERLLDMYLPKEE